MTRKNSLFHKLFFFFFFFQEKEASWFWFLSPWKSIYETPSQILFLFVRPEPLCLQVCVHSTDILKQVSLCLRGEKEMERREWQPTPAFLLENSKDRGTWQATVHGVSKGHTRLRDFHFHMERFHFYLYNFLLVMHLQIHIHV